MVTAFYGNVLALLICYLVLQVVKVRRSQQIRYADGNNLALQIARTAHSNAIENIPIALILLFALELNGGSGWLVHGFGVTFVVGRLIHCRGILTEWHKGRVLGMQLTIFPIILLAIANFAMLAINMIPNK